MTDWDIETLEDFDGTLFDDGTGWKIVFQIHMGISVRAKITQHPIRIGNFATQVSGLVWTADYEIFGFKDLPTRLREYYAAIESLLSSNENIRWTETSGRSPEWTIESLIADIGMGEFEPLIKPQAPEPFVWLIAALNRLTHPKLKRPLALQGIEIIDGSYLRVLGPDEIVDEEDSTATDDDDMWNAMSYGGGGSDRFAGLGSALRWIIYEPGFGRAIAEAIGKTKAISLVSKHSDGTIPVAGNDAWFRFIKPSVTQVDYICSFLIVDYTGPTWTVVIGTSEEISMPTYGGYIVESDGPDLDFEGTKTVQVELLTERPISAPFTLSAGKKNGSARLSMTHAWIYCDLPEVMGVGEITAPIPTASGEAEWEE